MLVDSLSGCQQAKVVGSHFNPKQQQDTLLHRRASNTCKVVFCSAHSLRHSGCPMSCLTREWLPSCHPLLRNRRRRGLLLLRWAGLSPCSESSGRGGVLGGGISPRWGDGGRPRPLRVLLEELQQRSPAPSRGRLSLPSGSLCSGWVGGTRSYWVLHGGGSAGDQVSLTTGARAVFSLASFLKAQPLCSPLVPFGIP